MRTKGIISLIALGFLFGAGSASAQNIKSYVSSTGSDANSCALGSPCRTFQRGHDQTNAGGYLYALDATADYGALTISKGITIYAPNSDPAGRPPISVASGNAITVNAPTNATVTLVNLEIDGQGTADNGILFNTGFQLQVFGGVYRRFGGASPNGFGIKFTPAALSKLLVDGSTLIGNGTASAGGGVQVTPGPSGAAQILLSHVRSTLNAFGLAVDTTANPSGGVNGVINGGEIHANRQDGVVLVGGAPIAMLIKEAAVFANANNGVRAIGTGVTARLYHSGIAGNSTGVAAVGGGVVASYGNNSIDANSSNGTPTPITQE